MQKSDFDEYKYFEEWAKEKLKLKNRSVDVIEELNTTIIDYAKYLAKNEELLLIMFNGDKEFGGKFGKILLDLKLFFDDTSVYCGFREVDFYEENLKQSAYYWNSAYNRYILNTEG